ncbi:hypothetical protein [Deinococcus gobiensis]|uniref:hypothetical protein n=1 Tax=Deinococcus gobiensis TaxID=502394 RepID=UPI0014616683|nr:hypothetical protein [Deinococcus gobiensis]
MGLGQDGGLRDEGQMRGVERPALGEGDAPSHGLPEAGAGGVLLALAVPGFQGRETDRPAKLSRNCPSHPGDHYAAEAVACRYDVDAGAAHLDERFAAGIQGQAGG